MKKRIIGAALIIFGLYLIPTVFAGETAHWGYSGHQGPEHWGELDPKFFLCSKGKNQSPVNLSEMIESDLPPIKINYKSGGNEILNNGHTIQVNYGSGSTIIVDGNEFELKQFHFHSPSENTIEGHAYPMEAHFVHADKDGRLAVIAVMFKYGEKNTELEKAWAYIPNNAGEKRPLSKHVDANILLPHDHDYFRFNGSLTTPPCSEGVLWIVMKYFHTASKQQIDTFTQIMHHPNNRPLQPANARAILKQFQHEIEQLNQRLDNVQKQNHRIKRSGFLVTDSGGRSRIGLGMEQEIPSIALTDTNGKKTVGIGGGQTGYGFSVATINTLQEA